MPKRNAWCSYQEWQSGRIHDKDQRNYRALSIINPNFINEDSGYIAFSGTLIGHELAHLRCLE
jgi:hypothetical protein